MIVIERIVSIRKCDQQQIYVDIVGGISEKRPNDYMSLDDTRARIKFAIDIHDPNLTDGVMRFLTLISGTWQLSIRFFYQQV